MGFDLGAALVSLGQSGPGIGQAFDTARMNRYNINRQQALDEQERIRQQAALDALKQESELRNIELAQKRQGMQQTQAADNAFMRYTTDLDSLKQAKQIGGGTVPEVGVGYAGPINPQYQGKLAGLGKMKPTEIASEYQLPYHAAYSPGVKSAVEQINKEENISGKGGSFEDRMSYVKAAYPDMSPADQYQMASAPGSFYQLTPEGMGRVAELTSRKTYATIPGKVATTEATGGAEATTPDFVAQRQKEWKAAIAPYAEALQNYAFAKSGTGGAIDDVALIKALEKVREPGSAVMFGDAEIWRKAGNFWDKANEGGFVEAVKAGTTKRLPESYRKQLVSLLENAMQTAKTKAENMKNDYVNVAKADYGWDESKASRIYTMPSTGTKKSNDGWTTKGGIKFRVKAE